MHVTRAGTLGSSDACGQERYSTVGSSDACGQESYSTVGSDDCGQDRDMDLVMHVSRIW